jgi:outer membrane protein assembly factor BamD (BamD/ComL family)
MVSFFYKMSVLIFFQMAVLTGFCFAQASSTSIKGYSRYLKNEFPKAQGLFKEALIENEDDVIANFGLALLYSNSSFQFDGFKAFFYIRKAKEDILKLNEVQLSELSKDVKEIPDVKGEIIKSYDAIEKKLFESITNKPTISESEKFVNEFPDSKYMVDVMQIRNNEWFNKVKEENKVVNYNTFIERFPDATALPDAIKLRNEVAYHDLALAPVLEKAYEYLNRYPDSELTGKVILLRDSLEYENTKRLNTIEAYSAFIEKYPKSRQIEKAINQYIQFEFAKAQARNSVKDYQEFINRYYSSEKGQIAVTMRDYEQINELKQKNTVSAYNNYISLFPTFALKTREVINLRNKKAYEDAMELNTIPAIEEFVYNYPAAPQVKEAMEKRDTLIINNCRSLTSEYRVLEFLRPYPKLQKSSQAIAILEEVAFKEAEQENTKEAYEEFLKNYPLSAFTKKATEKRDRAK